MSSVRVAYFWADGSHMDAQVWADDAYLPEAIAVARVSAVEALVDAMSQLEDDGGGYDDVATTLAELDETDE